MSGHDTSQRIYSRETTSLSSDERSGHQMLLRIMEHNFRKYSPNYRLTEDDITIIKNGRRWCGPIDVTPHMEPMTHANCVPLLKRYKVATPEAIINDRMDDWEKVLGFVMMGGGRKTLEEIQDELDSASYVTSIGGQRFKTAVNTLISENKIIELKTEENGKDRHILRAVGDFAPVVRVVTDCTKHVDGSPLLVHRCLKITPW